MEIPEEPPAPPADKPKRARPKRLQVTVHYRRDNEALHVALKLTLPSSFEERSCRTALVEPFIKAYDKKHPEDPASAGGPFEMLRVQCWSGPRPSAADQFQEERPPEVEAKVRAVMAPTYYLFPVDVTVKELRSRASDAYLVDVELVPAESTALVSKDMPSSALVVQGELLLTMLEDPAAELSDMHAIVDHAISKGEISYVGVAMARDKRGRTPLHLSITRGDLALCRKLMRREADVLALDDNRDTALTVACLSGRTLIVRELLENGALVHEKNRDLMLPLQLAVVDEAQGNGDVVRMLIEAGADMDAKCWDITPLMSAAAGGHYWAVQTLLELGADPNIGNGYQMMALDYARDQDTAQLVYDFMKGDMLPDADLLRKTADVKKQQSAYGAAFKGMPGMPGEKEKQPRLFQSVKHMPLEDALRHLGLPNDWLNPFRERGEYYQEIRSAWRRLVLHNHPDKQAADIDDEQKEELTAIFTRSMAAFEAVDDYYGLRGFGAEPEPEPEPESA